MNFAGVVHVRVDSALEDVLKMLRLRVGSVRHTREMDINESGDMAEVEEADMPEVDRFLVEHFLREHFEGDADISAAEGNDSLVPELPEAEPFIPLGHTLDLIKWRHVHGRRDEADRWTLEKPKAILRVWRLERVHDAQVRVFEQVKRFEIGVLQLSSACFGAYLIAPFDVEKFALLKFDVDFGNR